MEDKKRKPLAIISGGTGYVGSAIGAALREGGWNVASLTKNVKSEDRDAYECDVTNEKSIEAAIKKIIEQFGSVAACIHTATMPIENRPILDISPGSFDAHMAIAARGAFLLAKTIIPHMFSGAAFIGITTKLLEPEAALSPMGAYIPAKYALRGFLRVLSTEVRSKGIRVYAIAPGFLPGGLNKDLPKTIFDLFAKKSGVGASTAEDVAALVRKLCINDEVYPAGSSITLPESVISRL